jgi:hypothetical protein
MREAASQNFISNRTNRLRVRFQSEAAIQMAALSNQGQTASGAFPARNWRQRFNPRTAQQQLLVALGHRFFVIGTPGVQPGANFRACQVLACFLKRGPGGCGFPPEAFAGLFARNVLLDRFAHDPVSRSMPKFGKPLNAAFQFIIDLDRRSMTQTSVINTSYLLAA